MNCYKYKITNIFIDTTPEELHQLADLMEKKSKEICVGQERTVDTIILGSGENSTLIHFCVSQEYMEVKKDEGK